MSQNNEKSKGGEAFISLKNSKSRRMELTITISWKYFMSSIELGHVAEEAAKNVKLKVLV